MASECYLHLHGSLRLILTSLITLLDSVFFHVSWNLIKAPVTKSVMEALHGFDHKRYLLMKGGSVRNRAWKHAGREFPSSFLTCLIMSWVWKVAKKVMAVVHH